MPYRFRLFAAIALVGVLGLLAVLYGIWPSTVHAPLKRPAALAKLIFGDKAQAAPLVAFAGADGKPHSLAEFKGRYVLLNLWAPWCAPCVRELPALAALQAALPPNRLSVVAVDVARDTPAEATAFLKAHQASRLTVYVDTDISMIRAFGAFGLPLSVLIDRRGREIARSVGPADWDAPESIAYFEGLTHGG